MLSLAIAFRNRNGSPLAPRRARGVCHLLRRLRRVVEGRRRRRRPPPPPLHAVVVAVARDRRVVRIPLASRRAVEKRSAAVAAVPVSHSRGPSVPSHALICSLLRQYSIACSRADDGLVPSTGTSSTSSTYSTTESKPTTVTCRRRLLRRCAFLPRQVAVHKLVASSPFRL